MESYLMWIHQIRFGVSTLALMAEMDEFDFVAANQDEQLEFAAQFPKAA